jgi:heparan-sulfate lyase
LDWTQKNPRDDQHAYAWRSIEAGIRGHLWMNHFQRFLDAPSFTPQVLVAFLNSCYDHAAYLMTKYRKGSNWGLMEAEGMAFIAMTFPEFQESEKWLGESVSRLNTEIDNQVYPDGHQRELAMGYHTGSIGWFKRTLDLATMNGLKDAFPQSYLDKIEKMCEIPFKLGFPDGTTTQFGDSWTGSPGHIWPNLREWSKVFDRDDFLYVASEGREGKKPEQTAFALEHSGLYSMRSGWDRDAVTFVLKCGPDGGGHCQPDNGTFELYAGGRHLMPDGGSYIYSGDPENRAWFRQTKVHQTLTLNGANTAYAPRQLLWKPGDKLDVLVVENAGYPNLTHRRAVFFVDKKYFVIVDEAIGSGAGDVDLHFQLAPGDAIFDSTNVSVRTDFKDGWNVSIQSMEQKGTRLQEEEGWVSFVYTKKEPRPAFRFRIPKKENESVRFVTAVAPYEGVIPPKISVQIMGKPEVGSSKLKLKVTADSVSRKIGYEVAE